MSLKRKLTSKKPPLSAIDKFTYYFLILSTFAFWIFLIYSLWRGIPEKIAYSVDGAIAVNTDSISLIQCILLPYGAMMSSLLPVYGLSKLQPIFKVKKVKDTPLKHYIKVNPVFSKQFWKDLTKKDFRKVIILVSSIMLSFVLSIAISAFFVCRRTTLYVDKSIKTYNSFNEVKTDVMFDDANTLVLGIEKYAHRGSRHWYIFIEFVYEEESYKFTTPAFDTKTRTETLEYMLYVKEHFSYGEYELIYDEYLIKDLFHFENFSDYEKKLVYDLLDINA